MALASQHKSVHSGGSNLPSAGYPPDPTKNRCPAPATHLGYMPSDASLQPAVYIAARAARFSLEVVIPFARTHRESRPVT